MSKCVLSILVACSILTGCGAVALVTGTQEAVIEATVNAESLSPGTRAALFKARSLGVVSLDRAAIKAADVFEIKGAYTVKIDRVTAKQGEMTGSERREALASVCSSRGTDVALLGRIAKTETNNTAVAALSGRAKTNLTWVMEVLVCTSKVSDSFGGTLVLDVGIYNGNREKIDEAIGEELGSKILAAIGRNGSSTNKFASEQSKSDGAPIATAGTTVAVSKTATSTSANSVPSNLRVQQRLQELGYAVGTPDGVMGRRTTDAIKKFQTENALTATGKLDALTVEKLMIK